MHVTLRNPNCQKTVLDNGATLQQSSETSVIFRRLIFLFPEGQVLSGLL